MRHYTKFVEMARINADQGAKSMHRTRGLRQLNCVVAGVARLRGAQHLTELWRVQLPQCLWIPACAGMTKASTRVDVPRIGVAPRIGGPPIGGDAPPARALSA